jgi:phosphoribosylglycinamide formyltransferase-1
MNVVVIISGRGSNMQSLLAHQEHFEVTAVLSNKSEALGLQRAKEAGIETASFNRAEYPSLSAQKQSLYEEVERRNPDYVILAGYMQILESDFVAQYYGKIINIHPSLLPKLPGLHTHRRALEEQHPEHGCSVHFVDAGVDTGPIIAQKACSVLADDTPETLADRVLSLEHQIFPWAINALSRGAISLEGRTVCYDKGVLAEAKELNFILPAQQ